MDNYFKGENVEHEEVVDPELAAVLPPDFAWIKVRAGSKVRNLVGPIVNALGDAGAVLISGSGPATIKAVSCAEMAKRRFKSALLHQSSRATRRTVDELWEPKTEQLERLKVTREIPCLQIVLAKEAFRNSRPQTRSCTEQFLQAAAAANGKPRHKRHCRKSSGAAAAAARELGLEQGRKKKAKASANNGARSGTNDNDSK